MTRNCGGKVREKRCEICERCVTGKHAGKVREKRCEVGGAGVNGKVRERPSSCLRSSARWFESLSHA